MENNRDSQADIDWDNRVLCSDGNCIGVVGTDGRCKECGLPFKGDQPVISQAATRDPDVETTPPEQAAPLENSETAAAVEIAEEHPASVDDDDWENRRLCTDGNCIGIIGPDGHCKECGLPDETN